MAFKDLRGFLDALEAKGQLQRIKAEVDWDEEMGAIAQEAYRSTNPALLFENIKDYKNTPCRKVVMNTHSSLDRVKIAMGIPEAATPLEMTQIYRQRIKNPIKPLLVSSGPCKENIKIGDEVNLWDFPVPKLHGKDGGRYIMTWHIVITKDPETGWVNAGTYRGMVYDRNSIGTIFYPTQHWAIHGRKYKAMGKPMPVAVAIGLDPICMLVAPTPFPAGVNEFDMIGAVRQEPLELVKCETVDLEVPATAEIVIEGEMSLNPATFRVEGPFGEYPGYYVSLKGVPRPVIKVNCITYRNDPILRARMVGVVGLAYLGITQSAVVWDSLEAHGVQGIKAVRTTGTGGAVAIIAIEKLYYGHAKQVAAALWGTSLSAMVGKFVIVVDSDVDVYNWDDVIRAIANRARGGRDVLTYSGTFGGPLDPSNSPEVLKETEELGSWDRVLIDATWPFEWEAREEWGGLKHPPECRAEPDIVEKVLKRWSEYGFSE